jgi:hypothetical protein
MVMVVAMVMIMMMLMMMMIMMIVMNLGPDRTTPSNVGRDCSIGRAC